MAHWIPQEIKPWSTPLTTRGPPESPLKTILNWCLVTFVTYLTSVFTSRMITSTKHTFGKFRNESVIILAILYIKYWQSHSLQSVGHSICWWIHRTPTWDNTFLTWWRELVFSWKSNWLYCWRITEKRTLSLEIQLQLQTLGVDPVPK